MDIYNRFTGKAIGTFPIEPMANLSCANLSRANLFGDDLEETNLSRANLFGAILRGANLANIKMWDTIGDGVYIKSAQLGGYSIAYTSERLQIGCENHTIGEWWAFDDDEIDAMDEDALDWWRVWKPILQQIIEVSPAKKHAGHKERQA